MSQLAIDGTEETPEPVIRDGFCKCGCGDEVGFGMQYKNGAHRQRAYRRRVKAEMERVGLPPLPSLRAAGVSRPTDERNGDVPQARKGAPRSRSGLQVSYPKAIKAAIALAERIETCGGDRDELAGQFMEDALSPRQREVLQQRQERNR